MQETSFTDNDTFLKIGIHSMQGFTATTRHGVTRKKNINAYRKSV